MTALGVDFRDHTVLNQQYVDAAEKIFYTIVDRFQKFWLHNPWVFKFSSVKRTQDACLKILHNMSETVRKMSYLFFKYFPLLLSFILKSCVGQLGGNSTFNPNDVDLNPGHAPMDLMNGLIDVRIKTCL